MVEAVVKLAGAPSGAAWNALIEERGGSLCQRFEWKAILERAYGKRCPYLWAVDGEGRPVGCLPLVHLAGSLAGERLVSMPFLDLGGITADSPETALLLWREALALAGRLGARGVDLRGGHPPGAVPAPGQRFRLLLALPGSAEELWGTIGAKVRNQIRKAEKGGLSTRRTDAGGLAAFYRVFSRNMRDLGSPVHARRFFVEVLHGFGPRAAVYLTEDGAGTTVAAAIALTAGGTVTVPWASSLRSARAHCPNHSLYWQVLRDAVEAGAASFDFGRSTEGTGTYQFKAQWGAEPAPLAWGSFDLAGRIEVRPLLDARRNSALAGLWRRLPLGIANRLGPAVRRHLSN